MCVVPSVVCDRLITNGSGAGAPDLQGLGARAMARDRPSPYGEGGVFSRSAGACPPRSFKSPFFTVARGPVPRDPSNEEETFFPQRERWRGTGPRPTMKGRRYFFRSAGACPPRSFKSPFFTVARGPVPRDPSNEEETFFPQRGRWRGTGPRPTMRGRRFLS